MPKQHARPFHTGAMNAPIGLIHSRIHYPAGYSQYETGLEWSECHADQIAYIFAEASFPPVRGSRKLNADEQVGDTGERN